MDDTRTVVEETIMPPAHSLQALLGALAVITREVADHLETNSSAIGQDLMKTGECSSEIVVKLQDFDRMRQQLTAVGDVLEHCTSLILHAAPHNVDTIVAQVSMRQMRHRIQDAIERNRSGRVERDVDEQVF
jgi:hypothetical protein